MIPNLYKLNQTDQKTQQTFATGELISINYHDTFDYPLSISEMTRWQASDKLQIGNSQAKVQSRGGYYFKKGKDHAIYKRLLNKRISQNKFEIAKKAGSILSKIPLVKMVAITGSLAMENANSESDIDLMIVTSKGKLWTTRLFSYLAIFLTGLEARKAGDNIQKDKLCLNIWMDESDLKWKIHRNIYTAHEIAQVVPLVNKDGTYESFINENRWIKNYWPNAAKFNKTRQKSSYKKTDAGFFEKVAFWIQYRRMKAKITRETITPTRALFHPQDWGKIVLSRLTGLTS